MSELRWYQQQAVDDTMGWLAEHAGHPLIVLPTGAGKTHVITALCQRMIRERRETRILMLTHSQELQLQNYGKLLAVWPDAPVGIYSAALGRRDHGKQIVIGGPQSVVRITDRIGHIDYCIVDECDAISHKEEGSYRKIIGSLSERNPDLRVIGLTATPWRLGHGMITDPPAIFSEPRIEPVTIEDLIEQKWLCQLRSKLTNHRVDVSDVHVRGGEYMGDELNRAVDTDANNVAMANEIVAKGKDRKHWMVFCTGVEHAMHMRDLLRGYGVTAETIHGDMPASERDAFIAGFKAGRIRALTNVNVLTVGFDHPAIDLIAMCRPTLSPRLYVQIAGRGMRIAPGKRDCLFLDFVGAVETHGPITAVREPKRKGKDGDAPVRPCPVCNELVAIQKPICPDCGHVFEIKEKPPEPVVIRSDDIMGKEASEFVVKKWRWRKAISAKTEKEMLIVEYIGGLRDRSIREYLLLGHDGWAKERAVRMLAIMARESGAQVDHKMDLDRIASIMNAATPPSIIEYRLGDNPKFPKIVGRKWTNPKQERMFQASTSSSAIL